MAFGEQLKIFSFFKHLMIPNACSDHNQSPLSEISRKNKIDNFLIILVLNVAGNTVINDPKAEIIHLNVRVFQISWRDLNAEYSFQWIEKNYLYVSYAFLCVLSWRVFPTNDWEAWTQFLVIALLGRKTTLESINWFQRPLERFMVRTDFVAGPYKVELAPSSTSILTTP